jgi:MFS family permease
MLGWVSLGTDAATEAIYPLLPFFLTRVLGAGAIPLGLIEGVAEAASSIFKIVSGRLSDRWQRRQPIVLVGYALSSGARPFISLVTMWPQVLALRLVDRVGKGIRTSPRDAMLAFWASERSRGLVYGFHRAMDHAGAVVGPLAATLFLLFYPDRYRTLFALTAVPGAIAVFLLTRVPEVAEPDTSDAPDTPDTSNPPDVSVVSGLSLRIASAEAVPVVSGFSRTVNSQLSWCRELPGELYRYLFVLSVFTLGNSTDAFLLLRLTDVGGSPHVMPVLWALLHVVKVVFSIAGGSLSDRVGRRLVIVLGWLVYAIVYAGFAVSTTYGALVVWFLIYGLYFGLTEGVERALIADLAPSAARGTAFGAYNAVVGIGALLASVLFGALWEAFGTAAAFGTGASLALLASILLYVMVPERVRG